MEAAATPMNIVEGHSCKAMELKWVSSRGKAQLQNMKTPSKFKAPATLQASVPVFISTNPSHVKPDDLIDLYSACNLNGHRFPEYVDGGDGCRVVEGIDVNKLRVALSHSEVVVSVFCKANDVVSKTSSSFSQKNRQQQKISREGLGELLERVVMPVTPFNSQLVGFGRAVSDQGLTASIYDVMVIPSLQGMGIGKMIVKRIIRILTSRDIYDIAALCSESESSFFKACGFGDDILCSTAMMYTRTASGSTNLEEQRMVTRAGRKLLLVPPFLKTLPYSKSKTTTQSS